jgi:rhamnose transport system substrate-binding protein
MLKRILIVFTLVAGAGFFASCEKSKSGSTASSAKPTDAKSVKMVYIPKNTGNPYFDPMIEGFRQAATETGAQFDSVAPATADATSQLPIIKDQIQRGVNVIAISPNSPDALNPVFKEAMSKGITVLCVDSDLTGNEQFRTAGVLPTDPEQVGEGQIELLGKLMDYKGKFAILSATTDAPNQNEWINWMKEAMKDPKYKEMTLVDVVYGNDEPQKSSTECEALLTKYPDLRGIISPTTVGVAACAQTVESAGKASQIAVTGLGTPNQMRRFIQNGTVKAFALWSPKDEGYCAAQLGVQIATGKVKPEAGQKFTAGSLGEREIRKNAVVITGPPVVFDKSNIDQYHF